MSSPNSTDYGSFPDVPDDLQSPDVFEADVSGEEEKCCDPFEGASCRRHARLADRTRIRPLVSGGSKGKGQRDIRKIEEGR